jgi:transposase
MQLTTVGVDLAKNCFQVVEADSSYRIVQRARLTRKRFVHWMANHVPCTVVMEACGSAHYWARVCGSHGHEVKLLPAQHVRAYVRRNKTDAADAAALIEASRSEQIRTVAPKSVEQQALQQLHRLRAQWNTARVARINALRGMLREFGIDIPVGVRRGLPAIAATLESAENGVPDVLRPFIAEILGEIDQLAEKAKQIERALDALTAEDPVVQRLQQLPGIGLIASTGLRAAISDIHRFSTARHLASWLGLTAREHSSGQKRRLGGISKQGDVYLRMLLIHGARAVLLAAKRTAARGAQLDCLRTWALQAQARIGHNKAVVALANKLARICWATWKHERDFNANWSSMPAVAG